MEHIDHVDHAAEMAALRAQVAALRAEVADERADADETLTLALPIVRAAAALCAAPVDPAHGEPPAVDRAAYERLRAALATLHGAWVAALRAGEGLE